MRWVSLRGFSGSRVGLASWTRFLPLVLAWNLTLSALPAFAHPGSPPEPLPEDFFDPATSFLRVAFSPTGKTLAVATGSALGLVRIEQ
jgi:hypothetical protein